MVHQNHGFLLSLPPDGSFTHPDHVTIDTVRRYLYVYISVKASLDLLCFPSRSYQEHDPLFPSHGLLCFRAYFRILSYMSKLTFLCHLPTKSSISHFQEILGISWSEAYVINAGGYGIQEAWPFQCFCKWDCLDTTDHSDIDPKMQKCLMFRMIKKNFRLFEEIMIFAV